MLFYDLAALICIGVGHIYLFHILLGNTKISGRFVILLAVFFTTFLSISLSLTGVVELNVILIFLFLVLLGRMKKRHHIIHIIYFALLSIVLFTVIKNGLFMIFYELYLDSPFNYYVWTSSVIHFCTLLFILIVFFLARNFIKAAGYYLLHSKLYISSYAFVVVCILLLLIVNKPTLGLLAELNNDYGKLLYYIVLLIALIIMALITILTYVSKEQLIEKHEQAKQEQFMEYVEKLESLHDELSTFRHDYANILLSLEQSIRAGDMEQVKHIYEQTIAPTALVMNHQELELTKLSRIGLPEVKSVMSMKVLAAQRKSLFVQLDIPQPILYRAMPNDQFIRILSVLLDNAIEEAEKTRDKILQIALFEVENTQFFVVKNSVDMPIVNVEELYEKNYSSKGEKRGIGLFSVQRIIENYPNVTLSTSMDEAIFTQALMMKQPFTMKTEPFRKS